jgi:hypothetical protein
MLLPLILIMKKNFDYSSWYAGVPIAYGYIDQNGKWVGSATPGVYQGQSGLLFPAGKC